MTRRPTGDVALREVVEDDLTVFFEHQRDPVAARMAAFPPRDREAFMAHWARILVDEQLLARTILVDGRVAGNVVSWEHDRRRLVGYWVGRGFWGRGVATRALSRFLEEVGTRPLYAFVAVHNVASIRVLEKCGFRVSDEAIGPADEPDDGVEELLMELLP